MDAIVLTSEFLINGEEPPNVIAPGSENDDRRRVQALVLGTLRLFAVEPPVGGVNQFARLRRHQHLLQG